MTPRKPISAQEREIRGGSKRDIAETKLRLAYKLLVDRANADMVCPSDEELTRAVGNVSKSNGSRLLHTLQLRDLISVERLSTGRRVVTIIETGRATAVPPPVTRPQKPKFNVVDMRNENHPAPVYRDPCTYCGTRSDIGCRHTRRIAA